MTKLSQTFFPKFRSNLKEERFHTTNTGIWMVLRKIEKTSVKYWSYLRRVSLFQWFCNNLDPVHRIQTKFGMDILLDPRNKPAEEFFIFLKIQDGRRLSKVQNRPNFTPQIKFWLIIWIWFIRFGPNLAGRYYSTQGTSLCKNFLPIAKSKMAAAAAITANYEIGHNLKSIQFRDPIFFLDPCFQG